jgi:hypothetical protein
MRWIADSAWVCHSDKEDRLRPGPGTAGHEEERQMDPITISALLIALIGGVGSGLGTSLWTGLGSLVRRPFRRRQESAGQASQQAPAAEVTGEQQLAVLEQTPKDTAAALALAHVLAGRADADPDFEQALQAWWDQAEPIRHTQAYSDAIVNIRAVASSESVVNRNSITGGDIRGPIFQGVNFSGITFGGTAMPAPPPGEQSGSG